MGINIFQLPHNNGQIKEIEHLDNQKYKILEYNTGTTISINK